MIKSITTFINRYELIKNNSTIIIGLSGGPDSMFLLHFLNIIKTQYNLTLIAAHLNHEWRINASDDVEFCAYACQQLNIPFVHAKASELAITIKKNGSQEAIGREMRRYFLEQIRKQYNADAIAVAHHEQDQQETFFIRLIRGATLTGLTSMRPKSGYYIRPLLQTSKNNILTYLHNHEISYLIDPTNISESYLRNRIRMKVLPALQEVDPRFDNNFLRTITSLQETEQFLVELTHQTFNELSILKNGIYYLNIEKLLLLHPVMLYHVLMHWLIIQKVSFTPTQGLLDEIQRFLHQKKSNKHTINPTWSIHKKHDTTFFLT